VAERTPSLRVCRAYQCADGTVTRLEPGPLQDLGYQEILTVRLQGARPVLTAVAAGDWVSAVEFALDVPIVLTSHGPTASDKQDRQLGSLTAPRRAADSPNLES
jgi:adenylosuccinate synthase